MRAANGSSRIVLACALWTAIGAWPLQAADLANGKRVFAVFCGGCHQPLANSDMVYARLGGAGGAAKPPDPPIGTFTLLQRYHGRVPEALAQRPNMTVTFVKRSVRFGVDSPKKPDQLGSSMRPMSKFELSDKELDDVAAYLARPR